jgi:Ni,Fe-hydrogenase I cytochrome b subunit
MWWYYNLLLFFLSLVYLRLWSTIPRSFVYILLVEILFGVYWAFVLERGHQSVIHSRRNLMIWDSFPRMLDGWRD